MGSIRDYFGNISSALSTTAKGMGVTLHHFIKEPPITVQYPFERMDVPDRYRGVHILDQDICIDCGLCAKACPVDCIEIESVHHGRVLEWKTFSIDYKKCIFCEFCIPPCPVDCIHMTTEYEMATDDPDGMVEDLLTWTGLRPEDQRAIEAVEAKKAGTVAPEEKEEGAEEEGAEEKGAEEKGPEGGSGGDDMAAKIAAIKARIQKKKDEG